MAVASGRAHQRRNFFLRGEVSAVNSLFADSVYAAVSEVVRVIVAPLDDIVDERPRLVKIDVEGAELDVIGGMTRLLYAPDICLVVEWHPLLQEAAGYSADALPRALWERGFSVHAVSHGRVAHLARQNLAALTAASTRSSSGRIVGAALAKSALASFTDLPGATTSVPAVGLPEDRVFACFLADPEIRSNDSARPSLFSLKGAQIRYAARSYS